MRCARSTAEEIVTLLERALKVLGLAAPRESLEQIAVYSNGDARAAYNLLELASAVAHDGVLDRGGRRIRAGPQDVALRQERGRALQPDFRAA